MRSLQHVLWRGAMAASLLVLGIGSGVGLAEVPAQAADAAAPACDDDSQPHARHGVGAAGRVLALEGAADRIRG